MSDLDNRTEWPEHERKAPMTQPTPGALTRHDYRECPVCTANRPRFCEQYYETENAVFIEQVKAAIEDCMTPGGVKATYEQLLDMNAALRLTLAQQAQEIERLRRELADYKADMDKAIEMDDLATADLKQQLAAMATAREAALELAERALHAKGYRRECNIAACNCGSIWSHGGHLEARIKEIDEALPWVNGKTILTRVNEMVEERNAAVQRAERAEAKVKELEGEA